ncbi:MAG: NADH-quinone oxidoreductase subunit NuoK [Deinococcales bacterium]
MLTLNHFLGLSTLLFAIGLFGVLSRRNLVAILMSVEIMLNAALINFVAVARFTDNVQGDLFTIFVIAIAAAEVGVGLAIFLNVFKQHNRVSLEVLRDLRE